MAAAHDMTRAILFRAFVVVAVIILAACDAVDHSPSVKQQNRYVTSERQPIGSGIVFLSQRNNEIADRVVAGRISVVPRSFGAFNLNGLNELLVEDAHIEIYPSAARGADDEGMNLRSDLLDSLQKYAQRLPPEFGVISRIRMENARITLHQAGEDGVPVNVTARLLLKELKDGAQPELYDAKFYDQRSSASLLAKSAVWNTHTGQFTVELSELN